LRKPVIDLQNVYQNDAWGQDLRQVGKVKVDWVWDFVRFVILGPDLVEAPDTNPARSKSQLAHHQQVLKVVQIVNQLTKADQPEQEWQMDRHNLQVQHGPLIVIVGGSEECYLALQQTNHIVFDDTESVD